jgi:hypothetical protein
VKFLRPGSDVAGGTPVDAVDGIRKNYKKLGNNFLPCEVFFILAELTN